MTRFGRELGIAFQIADDVLDLVGKEDETGKSLGTDLDQKKLTLPLIRLLRESAPERRERVRSLLADSPTIPRDRIAAHLRESDALSYSTRVAEQHAATARQQLACLPSSECRRILEELTWQAVHRRR
jgi:octaprenyl-diphosphate synthase